MKGTDGRFAWRENFLQPRSELEIRRYSGTFNGDVVYLSKERADGTRSSAIKQAAQQSHGLVMVAMLPSSFFSFTTHVSL